MTTRNVRIVLPNNDAQYGSQCGIANEGSQEVDNWDLVSTNSVQGDVVS